MLHLPNVVDTDQAPLCILLRRTHACSGANAAHRRVRIDHLDIGVGVPTDAITGATTTAWRAWIISEHVGHWRAVHKPRQVQRQSALADLVRSSNQIGVRNPACFMGALKIQACRAMADRLPSAGFWGC